jgi:putative colanic acid biosynthesis UDP-glucose lipid carrier transferase
VQERWRDGCNFSSAEKPSKSPVSVQEQFGEAGDTLPILTESFGLAPVFARPKSTPRTRRIQAALKRTLDLAIALPMLILLAPLLIAVAVFIKLDSAGPALFRQSRVGLNGRAFGILKFRTMNVVEDGDAVVQAERNDARVTRMGAFLRVSSIDELPQLLNVIAGDMSLVGPRPHAIAHDIHYASLIPEYIQRQRVKPGITGWAQVNGYRGGTPTLDLMQCRVDLDIWYTNHASIALDLAILARTPLELMRNRNVY